MFIKITTFWQMTAKIVLFAKIVIDDNVNVLLDSHAINYY